MKDDLKDILSNSNNNEVDNKQLMEYLRNQLNNADAHEVEKNMADDAFVNDAIEGLQNFDAKKDVQSYVTQLHEDLNKQLSKKKKRKEKRRIKEQPWVYLAIVIILLLLVLCFVVMWKHLESK